MVEENLISMTTTLLKDLVSNKNKERVFCPFFFIVVLINAEKIKCYACHNTLII